MVIEKEINTYSLRFPDNELSTEILNLCVCVFKCAGECLLTFFHIISPSPSPPTLNFLPPSLPSR